MTVLERPTPLTEALADVRRASAAEGKADRAARLARTTNDKAALRLAAHRADRQRVEAEDRARDLGATTSELVTVIQTGYLEGC